VIVTGDIDEKLETFQDFFRNTCKDYKESNNEKKLLMDIAVLVGGLQILLEERLDLMDYT